MCDVKLQESPAAETLCQCPPMKPKDAELAHRKMGLSCLTSAWITTTPSSAFQIPSIRFRCRLSLFSIEPSTLRLYRGPSVPATVSPAAALALDLIAVSRISLVHRSLIVRLLLDSTLKGIPLLKSCVASEDVL